MALILIQLTTKNLQHTKPETWDSIRRLDIGPHTVDLHVLSRNDPKNLKGIRAVHQGYNMERSRGWAIAYNYDYYFIVQSDIIFPPNTLLKLLEVMKRDNAGVVCPLTPERPEKVKTDGFVVEMRWNGNPHARGHIAKGEDFVITGNGSGYMCVLVRRDVFHEIKHPAEGSGDIHWYQALHRAKVKIICEVGLRLFHKQKTDNQIIRGNKYVIEHWRKHIELNKKHRKPWHDGLFKAHLTQWIRGLSEEAFLEQLEAHIDEDRFWWAW